jgi:DNA uptake protein ComE-like DNA-binding protein
MAKTLRSCLAGVVVVALAGCGLRGEQLDLNAASASELARIDGIGRTDAERIVAHRPYMSRDELLGKKVVTRDQYNRLAGRVFVGPPGIPDYLRSVPPQTGD